MIRQFKQTEKEALLDILKVNTPLYFHPKELEDFSQYLDANADFYFVYLEAGTIAGGAGWHLDDAQKSGSISWVLCRPEFQGMGIGKSLVETCLDRLRQEKKIQKIVVRTSQLAYRFFTKFGFEVVETRENYWGPGLDLYLMEMKP